MINQLGYYLKANGTTCKIEQINEKEVGADNCYDDRHWAYYPDGRYYQDESDRDIIAYIPPALQFEILRIIEAYHTTESFKSMIDNCYKNHLEKKGE